MTVINPIKAQHKFQYPRGRFFRVKDEAIKSREAELETEFSTVSLNASGIVSVKKKAKLARAKGRVVQEIQPSRSIPSSLIALDSRGLPKSQGSGVKRDLDFRGSKSSARKEGSNRVTKVGSEGRVTKDKEIEAIFNDLVEKHREEAKYISSSSQIAMSPSYQKIIGLGEPAIPLLLKELERKSGRWFWALKSITRVDPVPAGMKGNTKQMIKAWLDWGKENGYL